MTIIDTHQHFWEYDPERHSWISEEMAILKKNYLPPELDQIYEKHSIGGCISVQAEQSEAETNFLLGLARQFDFIKGVVGWVDLQSEEVEQRLAHFAQFPELLGFRHIVQDEPDSNFMLREAFQRGISHLKKFDFTYDILIYPNQMGAALQTIRNFPEQPFMIDHIAKPSIKAQQLEPWAYYIREIAEYPNVYCKLSGMITEADWKNWEYRDLKPYLEIVYDAFGPERLVFGSDWPVCLLAGSYKNVISIVEGFIQRLSVAEQEAIMSQNAIDFYKIAN